MKSPKMLTKKMPVKGKLSPESAAKIRAKADRMMSAAGAAY